MDTRGTGEQTRVGQLPNKSKSSWFTHQCADIAVTKTTYWTTPSTVSLDGEYI